MQNEFHARRRGFVDEGFMLTKERKGKNSER